MKPPASFALSRDESDRLNLSKKEYGTSVMKKAGTFDYYCRYHPNMIGRLVVTGPVKKK